MSIKHLFAPLLVTLGLSLFAAPAAAQEPSVQIGASLTGYGGSGKIAVAAGQYGGGRYGGDRHGGRPWIRYRSTPRHRTPSRQWVPGHYEWTTQRVWIPERYERIWIEPLYEWRTDYSGRRYRVLVRAGYWDDICRPGYYDTRRTQVWRPGHWTYPRGYCPPYR